MIIPKEAEVSPRNHEGRPYEKSLYSLYAFRMAKCATNPDAIPL